MLDHTGIEGELERVWINTVTPGVKSDTVSPYV